MGQDGLWLLPRFRLAGGRERRETTEKFLAAAMPLLDRLDRANRRMLIPSLADGQTGLVVNRKLASKQFVDTQPATEKPLPMIEPALIFGVSDADLLKKAMSDYRFVVNGLITASADRRRPPRSPRTPKMPSPK